MAEAAKTYADLVSLIEKSEKEYDLALIEKAYKFAEAAHQGQVRRSGEPYIIHPIAVAYKLVEFGMDTPSVVAGLLHDVIEDTPVTYDDIVKAFGKEIANLTDGVTKLGKIPFSSREEQQAENLRKMLIAMSEDIRVIIIKFADRMHNLATLEYVAPQKQRDKALECLEVYAPIAHRLGMRKVKEYMEDISLKYLDPVAYKEIEDNLEARSTKRKQFIETTKEMIRSRVEPLIPGVYIEGRVKSVNGIYRKMFIQGKSFDEIYDVFALRVIVDTINDCYNVLGIIHDMFTPLPNRFKDYISTPKQNMYQSLHTTVISKEGIPFEVQIRTWEMHHTAEYGIAAHWKYKEGRSEDENTNFENKLTWLREVMEWQGAVKDSREFLAALKTELYSDELLVFTPRGKVISLPPGATPVDFAYAIHSEVGNRCTGARVNSKIVPLSTTLEVGDVVEIITSPNSKGPSRDWLKFIKSSSAKAKIKQFYKNELKEDNIRIGQARLEEEAKKRGYTLSALLTDESFKRISERYSFGSRDEMFAAVGYGSVSVNQVLFKLIDFYKREMPKPFEVHAGDGGGRTPGGVLVNGQSGLLVRFAGCCSPVPGDKIVGYTSRGRGVVIHRADCPNIHGVDEGRLLPAAWNKEVHDKHRYNANIMIRATDQGAALSVLSGVVSDMKLSITAVNGRIDKNRDAVLEASVSLTDVADVDMLLKKLRADKRIYDVHRITSLS